MIKANSQLDPSPQMFHWFQYLQM